MNRIAWRLVACLLPLVVAGRSFADATSVHVFAGPDGSQPLAGLVLGGDGNFYGTTSLGGVGVTNPAGTVFRLTPDGTLTTLYTFDFQLTGDRPYAGVIIRKRLDPVLRDEFLGAGAAITPDVTSLRATLACPGDAAAL